MELEGIINGHFHELNENEKAIIEYIIKNKANCQEMTIIELAKETLTSKSSILRLTQKLGFSGYSEFKYSIRKDISKQNNVGQEYDLYSMQRSGFFAMGLVGGSGMCWLTFCGP